MGSFYASLLFVLFGVEHYLLQPEAKVVYTHFYAYSVFYHHNLWLALNCPKTAWLFVERSICGLGLKKRVARKIIQAVNF